MLNFTYYNPVRVVFGRGTIAELAHLVPPDRKVMMTYGEGAMSWMRGGVYEQIMDALSAHTVVEFGGIEANPRYETLMGGVELARREGVGYLLAVGGGSVSDGTKFMCAAIPFQGEDPWDIIVRRAPLATAVPHGCVTTLPATSSEVNSGMVISRNATKEKFGRSDLLLFAEFAILDPETTYTLPERQTGNGIVDAFVHVFEQYLTHDVNAPLQDRQAEGILLTLIEEAPKVRANPYDYDVRANLMWCASQGLNGLIRCGVPGDWSSHAIGHELTAFFGIDHGQSLAVICPAVIKHQRRYKAKKLIQYGRRVWGLQGLGDEETIDAAIARTEAFFHSVGLPTRLGDHDLTPADCQCIVDRFRRRGSRLGERQAIGADEVAEILALCA
jgi:NADP-dependent alcohol dehydrogenase